MRAKAPRISARDVMEEFLANRNLMVTTPVYAGSGSVGPIVIDTRSSFETRPFEQDLSYYSRQSGLARKQVDIVLIHQIHGASAATGNAGQRIFGNNHRQTRFFGQ